VGFGIAEQHYYRKPHISLETLYQSTLWDFGVINLLEKLLNLLQIQGYAPLVSPSKTRASKILQTKSFR